MACIGNPDLVSRSEEPVPSRAVCIPSSQPVEISLNRIHLLLAIGSPIYLGACVRSISISTPLHSTSVPLHYSIPAAAARARRACQSLISIPAGRPSLVRRSAAQQTAHGMASRNKVAALLLCFLFLAAVAASAAEVCVLYMHAALVVSCNKRWRRCIVL
jgi:hypothetical protein